MFVYPIIHLMKRNLRHFFLLFLSLYYFLSISAEDFLYLRQDTVNSETPLTWVNFGIGGLVPFVLHSNSVKPYGYIAENISLSFQYKIHVISLKSIYHSKEFLGNNKLSNIELTYGLIHKRPLWYCSLSTGINYTCFTSNEEYERVGIPLDLQLFLTDWRFGVGIDGFLVIGKDFYIYGVSFCFQFGKLRQDNY